MPKYDKVPSHLKRVFSEAELEYLTAMKCTGLYGYTIEDVIRRCVQSGIQKAVENGFTKLREFPDLDEPLKD